MLKKWLKIILGLFVLGYVGFCGVVYFCPQLFFYEPSNQASRLEVAKANGYDAARVEYRAQDGTKLYGWYTPPKPGIAIIVFMHGNAYNIEKFYHKLVPLAEAGYGTMLPEYRGFGDVEGKITQAGLDQDAEAAVEYLRQKGFENQDIVLYGMSLGSYTATHAAYIFSKEEPVRGLILEVPFDSMYEDVKDIVSFPLPLSIIMRDKYDNVEKIKELNVPLLIMGGSDDTLVPIRRAKALFDAANQPKKMIVYKGAGHNDLYNYRNYRDIINWLKSNEKTR